MNMEIQLNDNYRITSDKLNYILQKLIHPDPTHHKTKDISPRWVDVGYYGNLSHLINSLIELEIKESEVNNLIDLNNKIQKFLREIKQSLDRLQLN